MFTVATIILPQSDEGRAIPRDAISKEEGGL